MILITNKTGCNCQACNETDEFVQSYCKKNKHLECGEFGWDVFTRILAGPGNEFPNKKTGCNCQAGNENEEFVQAL